jgi:release factor glutamine methyltransferase
MSEISNPIAPTVGQLLADARQCLAAAPFRPVGREAVLLMARALGCNEARVLAHPEEELDAVIAERFQELLARRLSGEPIAYIFGEREFYGRLFTVDPRVLIPRPETEHLVELALELELPPQPRILDLGTGSGCVAVTLACELPFARLTATDLSPAALAVARANALRHGVADRVRLAAADLAQPLQLESFDLVVSNPPYVDLDEAPLLSIDVRDHEPALAIFAPRTRLSIVQRLSRELGGLAPGTVVAFEIGAGRDEAVAELLVGSLLALTGTRSDYAGIPRVVVTKRTG